MLTIIDCLNTYSLQEAALIIANKVAFDKGKGYARSWDNRTYWEYASRLDKRIQTLNKRILEYQFQPTAKQTRRVKWKERILYISTWEDKIVETWLSKSLNKLLSKWFSHRSYAYRIEKIGVDTCQQEVIEKIRPCRFMARRDIRNFFYSIDHNILLAKLAEIIDPNDPLYRLVSQRIQFDYYEDDELHHAKVGVPFGSPLACVLANVYLTSIDHIMTQCDAHYFRYADDFLIISQEANPILRSAEILRQQVESHKLELHPDKAANLSFEPHPQFQEVNRFKYLGLEYWYNGTVRLPIEKKRKIFNIFRRTLIANQKRLRKIENLDERLREAINCVREAALRRIRYAAIIDYYLKHVEDEHQLKVLDREIAEMVISTVLDKPFRPRDFRTIPYGKLRKYGLLSLVHRNRLHRHGQLNVPFLSLYNSILFERYETSKRRRQERINQMKMAKKLRAQAATNPR